MRNPWVLATLTVVGFLLISLGVSWLGVRNRLDSQTFGSRFIEVSDSLEYSFAPKHDFLNIVILNFKNPNLENRGQFLFTILEEGGEEIRNVSFSGWNIGDPGNVRFQFEPIPESSGRKLSIVIKPESEDDPPVSVSQDDEGKLALASYYRTVSKKEALSSLLKSWNKGISDNLGFFFIWGVVLGTTIWLGKRQK